MQLRPAFLTAALTSVAMVAVGTYGVTTSATPYELTANSTALEAEALAVTPAPNGSIYTDSTASGGKALGLWANATAYATVTQPASTKVVVRAKAQKCQGQPTMVVTVDGVTIGSTTKSPPRHGQTMRRPPTSAPDRTSSASPTPTTTDHYSAIGICWWTR